MNPILGKDLEDKNILIVVPLRSLNGTTQTFRSWIKYLYRLDYNVYLAGSKGNLLSWTIDYCKKQYIFPKTRLSPSFSRLFKIINLINKHEINIIWGVCTQISLLTGLAALLTNVNYLNIVNVCRRKAVWPPYKKWKFPLYGHMITVDNNYKNLLINESKIPSEYCHFVPAQFDLEELTPHFPKIKGQRESIIISLFRRFDKLKTGGVIKFLDFINENRELLGHNIFNLYGGGDSENKVKAKVNKLRKLGIKVNYKGFIKDIHPAMVGSDIIVGSERVMIEGVLSGKPCLVIDDDGLVDFVCKRNIKIFMFDNFSGYKFTDSEKISNEKAVSLFSNYDELILLSRPREMYDLIAEKYSALIGIKELINISKFQVSSNKKIIKISRILYSIGIMQSVQIGSAIKRRYLSIFKTEHLDS